MTLVVREYVRKPSFVMAVRVTEENMEEVAKWCDGHIRGTGQFRHIKVKVHKPMNVYQTKASVGNWVLKQSKQQYKVYTDQAFENSFNAAFDDDVQLQAAGNPIADEVARQMALYAKADVQFAVDLFKEQPTYLSPLPPSNPSTRDIPLGSQIRPDFVPPVPRERGMTQYEVGPNTGVFERYQRGELNAGIKICPSYSCQYTTDEEHAKICPGNVSFRPETPPVFENLPKGPDAEWPVDDPRHPQYQIKSDLALISHLVQQQQMTANRARQIADMSPEERAEALSAFSRPKEIPQVEGQA